MNAGHGPQAEVIGFLSNPHTHGRPVERVETHSAIVFLSGRRALKLKLAVRYSYLDFSTLELRRRACEAEVDTNRRTAPALYTGVIAVTRNPSGRSGLARAVSTFHQEATPEDVPVCGQIRCCGRGKCRGGGNFR